MTPFVSDHIKSVADEYGVTVEDIKGPGRTGRITDARAAVVKRLVNDVGLTKARAGQLIGRSMRSISYLMCRQEKA